MSDAARAANSSRASYQPPVQRVPSLLHSHPNGWLLLLSGLICGLLGTAVFHHTWQAGFVWDDRAAVLGNADVLPTTPWSDLLLHDFWGQNILFNSSHKSFRPVAVASFRFDYLQWGFEAGGYHITNTLLHGAVTALSTVLLGRVISGLLRLLGGGQGGSAQMDTPVVHWSTQSAELSSPFQWLLGSAAVLPSSRQQQVLHWLPLSSATLYGLMFALHPIHVEAVASVVSRADLLAAFFTFAALLLFWESRAAAVRRSTAPVGKGMAVAARLRSSAAVLITLLLTAAAVYSKETGITLYAGLAGMELLCAAGTAAALKRKEQTASTAQLLKHATLTHLPMLLLLLLSGLALLLLRMSVHWGVPLQVWTLYENQIAAGMAPGRLASWLSISYFHFLYLWLLVCPNWMSYYHGYAELQPVLSLLDRRNLGTLLCYGAMAGALWVCAVQAVRSWNVIVQQQEQQSQGEESKAAAMVAAEQKQLQEQEKEQEQVGQAPPSQQALPAPASSPASAPLLPLLVLAVCFTFLWSVLFLGLASFLPASNVFFYVGTEVAERLLYIPSAGFLMALAPATAFLLLSRLLTFLQDQQVQKQSVPSSKREKQAGKKTAASPPASSAAAFPLLLLSACLSFLLTLSGYWTLQRSQDWLDERSLFRRGYEVSDANVKTLGNLAMTLLLSTDPADHTQAELLLERAVSIYPQLPVAIGTLGILAKERGERSKALQLLWRSIRMSMDGAMMMPCRPLEALAQFYLDMATTSGPLMRVEESLPAEGAGIVDWALEAGGEDQRSWLRNLTSLGYPSDAGSASVYMLDAAVQAGCNGAGTFHARGTAKLHAPPAFFGPSRAVLDYREAMQLAGLQVQEQIIVDEPLLGGLQQLRVEAESRREQQAAAAQQALQGEGVDQEQASMQKLFPGHSISDSALPLVRAQLKLSSVFGYPGATAEEEAELQWKRAEAAGGSRVSHPDIRIAAGRAAGSGGSDAGAAGYAARGLAVLDLSPSSSSVSVPGSIAPASPAFSAILLPSEQLFQLGSTANMMSLAFQREAARLKEDCPDREQNLQQTLKKHAQEGLDGTSSLLRRSWSYNMALAVAYSQLAMLVQPQNVVFLSNAGALFTGLGMLEQAREVTGRALAVDPSSAAAWTNYGFACEKAGEQHWMEALKAYTRAAELLPGHAQIEANLRSMRERAGVVGGRAAVGQEKQQQRQQQG